MGRIDFTIGKEDALDAVKEAVSSKFAIMKDDGFTLKVGVPMMTATIVVEDGFITVEGKGAGKTVATTCESAIKTELKKASKSNGDLNNGQQMSPYDKELKISQLLINYKLLVEKEIIGLDFYSEKTEKLIEELKKCEIISEQVVSSTKECPKKEETINGALEMKEEVATVSESKKAINSIYEFQKISLLSIVPTFVLASSVFAFNPTSGFGYEPLNILGLIFGGLFIIAFSFSLIFKKRTNIFNLIRYLIGIILAGISLGNGICAIVITDDYYWQGIVLLASAGVALALSLILLIVKLFQILDKNHV